MQSSPSTSGRLTKGERTRLIAQQTQQDAVFMRGGVDFSRIQLSALMRHVDAGIPIEFEALGPYMTDYASVGYRLTKTSLTPGDQIGLQLNQLFRRFFPAARVVSLYDDYNQTHATEDDGTVSAQYALADCETFRASLRQLFITHGIASVDDDMLLLSESSKVAHAEQLVVELDRFGFIRHQGLEITFVPRDPERLFYDRIVLRTKRGKWLCAALDAAGFLDEQNRRIVHVVALPHSMKEQQDKVWEILRVLGISSERYHNIFYDPQATPETIVRTVEAFFQMSASATPSL
jgi:hypothetical protein